MNEAAGSGQEAGGGAECAHVTPHQGAARNMAWHGPRPQANSSASWEQRTVPSPPGSPVRHSLTICSVCPAPRPPSPWSVSAAGKQSSHVLQVP